MRNRVASRATVLNLTIFGRLALIISSSSPPNVEIDDAFWIS